MKFSKYLFIVTAGMLSLTSCNDWLDVNVDPNNPTSDIADYSKRLAHIEFYTNHAYQIGSQATSYLVGDFTQNSRTNNQGKYAQWEMTEWRCTTCYQWWFVGAACNLEETIETALAAEAYHYAGAAHLIKAYGFALMNDLHGELPYDDALSSNVTPVYNTGKEMFQYVMQDIDKAIEYLSMQQGPDAVPLSANDYWANGDVNKWLKFAYLLKARQLNHLIKKGAGTAADLKYDAQAILDCLNKAQQSNDDNMVIDHNDDFGPSRDVLGWGEPVDYSPLYSVEGMNANIYFTRKVYDNLNNFAGCGIEDPRADHILPWARSQRSANTPEEIYGQKVKWSADGKWRRTVGVDMNTTIRTENAPYSTSWDATKGRFYCDNEARQGDTIFIHQTCGSKGYGGDTDLFYYRDGKHGKGDERSAMSGTFMSRPSSPGYLAMYHEACFIRAEVLFRQGDKNGAFEAYRDGVRAHMEMMNKKLNVWIAEDANLARCPSFVPMTQADIDNYINNALGTAGDLTLGKIMTQKQIAMMNQIEQWNDMRRYDYNPEIFLNWHIPAEYFVNAAAQLTIPMGKYPRRWRVSSHEYRYNVANLNAIGEKVPGANTANGQWWNENDMWTIPVWWDSDQN